MATCVILFSCPPRLPRCVPVMSHMWMVESSLEASSSRPDSEVATLVKLEFGVGGLYCLISWSPRISHNLR